jgi:hypothetical protein
VNTHTTTITKVIDLFDTTNCALWGACEQCGSERDVRTLGLLRWGGVLCFRTCERCDRRCEKPPLAKWDAVMDRVRAHCEHLGITHTHMQEILLDEETR